MIKSTAKGTEEKKQAFDSLIYFDASFTNDGWEKKENSQLANIVKIEIIVTPKYLYNCKYLIVIPRFSWLI